jgi:hypothetical protein
LIIGWAQIRPVPAGFRTEPMIKQAADRYMGSAS